MDGQTSTLLTPDPSPATSPLPLEPTGPGSGAARARQALTGLRLFAILLSLALVTRFFVVVHAGERGVLLRWGAVQERILEEGIHPLLPVRDDVAAISVRVQALEMRAEASSRDLQDVTTDLAVNWHARPDRVNRIYQQLGDLQAVAGSVIEPAIEEVIKAVAAAYTAEEIVTRRGELKAEVDRQLSERLVPYNLELDDVSLVHVRFSERFRDAVEAKQVAEQEAKRAEYEAVKAQRLAEARVFQARGEAQAQQLLQTGLTAEVLQRQAIEKWNGHLPLVLGADSLRSIDFKSLMKADAKQKRQATRQGQS